MLMLGCTDSSGSDSMMTHMLQGCLAGAEAQLGWPEAAMSAIWRQLPAVKMEAGEVAQLPEHARLLLSHTVPPRLLVRCVYAEFWALINELPGDTSLLPLLVWPLPYAASQLASKLAAFRCCLHYWNLWHWQVNHVAVCLVAAGSCKGYSRPSHKEWNAPVLGVSHCPGHL